MYNGLVLFRYRISRFGAESLRNVHQQRAWMATAAPQEVLNDLILG
jgi:hypothetical protein